MIARIAVGVVTLLALGSTAFGQQPDPLLGTPAKTPLADPLLEPTRRLVECPPPAREDWRAALDFGLPTGVRVQRRLGESNLWAEGGVGVWWIVPYVSACVRYDCPLLRRERNLFAVRPGISATLILLGPNFGTGLDTEFIWQHTFNGRVTTELGFRLGMTAVFLDGRGRHSSGTWPVPVGTLTFAVAF